MDIILMLLQSLLKPRLKPRLLRLRERSVRLRLTLRPIPSICHMDTDSTIPMSTLPQLLSPRSRLLRSRHQPSPMPTTTLSHTHMATTESTPTPMDIILLLSPNLLRLRGRSVRLMLTQLSLPPAPE